MKKLILMAVCGLFVASTAMGNWVLNPGFEDGAVGESWQPEEWFIDDNGVWRNDANPRTGDWHLSIDQSQDPAAAQTVFDLSAWQNLQGITASAWVEVSGGTGGNLFFGANQRDDAGDFISNHESDGIWQGWDNDDPYPNNPTLTFDGASDLDRIELYFRTDEVVDRRFDIDDVSLVPEPGTMALLGMGLLGLFGLRRRMK